MASVYRRATDERAIPPLDIGFQAISLDRIAQALQDSLAYTPSAVFLLYRHALVPSPFRV